MPGANFQSEICNQQSEIFCLYALRIHSEVTTGVVAKGIKRRYNTWCET